MLMKLETAIAIKGTHRPISGGAFFKNTLSMVASSQKLTLSA
jgi:hypothetical protein